MPRKTKIDTLIDKMYAVHFNNVPVPMLALPAIYREIRSVLETDPNNLDARMADIVRRFRAD